MEGWLCDNAKNARARRGFPRRAVRQFCVLWLLVTTPVLAAGFRASLDRDTIMLGESVTLALSFEGGQPRGEVSPPVVPHLQITPAGQSSQYTFVNGRTASTVTQNFRIRPRQVGEYTIPAMTVVIEGQSITSPPLRLKVVKPSAPPPEAAAAANQPAFLRLVLPKKEVYVGEVVIAELQLYLRDGVGLDGFQLTATPAEGFMLGKMVQGQQRRMQVGNLLYNVIPVSVALTAIKTGPATLGPITATAVLQLPNARRRDSFFDPFGMFAERQQMALATDAEAAQSQPLPSEGVPANFNGAVGTYTLAVAAGPTNVATGDPITVRVQISGRGALDALSLPVQNAWHDFKVYPPTASVELADQLGLQGTKTFEQIVAPQSTDITELPAFSFSFFDPDARSYRTLTHPPTKLEVRPGGVAAAPVIAAGRTPAHEPAPPQQDIVPIKQRLGTLRPDGPELIQQPWFVAIQGLPMLAWVAAFVWRKRSDHLANNPRLRRQRHVAQRVEAGLGDLHRLAAAKDSDQFFATLFRILQEQIGERLDLPASSITEVIVDERLKRRGLPDTACGALHELFQTCNQARFAPVQSSHELTALIPRLEQVIGELRRLKP